ncbi:MAG: hypothetical protein EOO10_05805 [Chitinophagaceae bacterium]|nr:MAG: hypothetical protein EOO10_05805 [Chitinophagaceae bacterium]
MSYSNTGRLFSGTSSSDFFDNERQSIVNAINSKSQNELLNISIEQYSEYLYSSHYIDYPLLDTNNYTISSYEGDVPTSRFPIEFHILDRNKTLKRDIIVFHVPYEGDISYLNYRPSTFFLSGIPAATIRQNEFLFEYINFYNDPDRIKREFDNDLQSFKNSYTTLKADFEAYNNGLKDFIVREINNRRQALLAKNNFLTSFNVPLKSSDNTPKTFTIPSPKLREKITITKPSASNSGFTPEPTLDYGNYIKILKIIDDVGRNFERLPSIYKSKEEEDLRDHILMVLDPNFEYGSATGETFNKKGKTDILLRHDSSVAFVAECKFWGGEKVFLKTIDQLLSYLTWRDSKTAVVIFVRNKEIIPILQKIKEVTPQHSCYITTKGQKADNWSEHIFHLPADENKEVVLSILIFHLPDK